MSLRFIRTIPLIASLSLSHPSVLLCGISNNEQRVHTRTLGLLFRVSRIGTLGLNCNFPRYDERKLRVLDKGHIECSTSEILGKMNS